jgi:nicotinate-nucleotide adenylyltransferase
LPRIGILGGTFDPPHNGHIAIAKAALSECELQKVLFIPAKYPPHKPVDKVTPERDRVQMLELAIKDYSEFEMSDIELKREGPSYTIDTLQEIKKLYSGVEIIFIIGADNILEIESWYRPDEILQAATVVAFNRPGFDLRGKYESKIKMLKMSPVDISSSEIRDKIRANESIKDLVPAAVREYIEKNSLYKNQ